MNNEIINNDEMLQSIFGHEQVLNYERIGIKYNPFIRSGAANINDDAYARQLFPLTEVVNQKVIAFLANAMQENPLNKKDKFQSCVIMGDYGSGKTQLLMYIRSLINHISNNPNLSCRPYVVYVDNPGLNLLELIGRIVSEIGEENVRKYLWFDIINEIKSSTQYKEKLHTYLTGWVSPSLYEEQKDLYNPYSEENNTSYKLFLNAFIRQINLPTMRKKFESDFREILMDILQLETKDAKVANYFYEFLSSDYGVNKAWEGLTSGTLKQLAGKEAKIIGHIVSLVKKQGYTDFFILVDEFEDITEGRLSKAQLDNYIYNLRTLLDEQREWALFFSMNPVAYSKLRAVSPPLADRISAEQIVLNGLTTETAKILVENYIKIADGNGISPFTEEAIKCILDKTDGNTRQFVVLCYKLIEELKRSSKTCIDKCFVGEDNGLEGVL